MVNVLIKMVFIKFSDYEKPWTYTETFLSISTKISLFSFINSAIVPYVSTLIRYDSWTYQNLVTTISTTIVIGSIVSLLMSIIWKKNLKDSFY